MTAHRPRILIVEDEVIVREDLRDMLTSLGYEVVGTAMSGAEAITRAGDTAPDLVLMDIRLRGAMDGIEAASRIRQKHGIPVVFLTAFADDASIQRAKSAEPFGYLTKPLHERALRAAIEVALHRHAAPGPAVVFPGRVQRDSTPDMLGYGPAIRSLREEIARLAAVEITVLVEGETGTGKELAARALHRWGRRASGPFLAVNCAALTETLASTELFGHRKGAFTGAHQEHRGVFEAASGGTVFLDEIGDIPKSQQPYLLRVLEERVVTRVGETQPRPIDVRVIAATHRNLEDEVAAGRFRADLLYRIRVGRVFVPSLRQRPEDIPILANAFLASFARQLGRPCADLLPATVEALRRHAWPGNIRELRNAIEFAALRCPTPCLSPGPEDLPPEFRSLAPRLTAPIPASMDRDDLRRAILQAGGNRTEAARLLGISRATLYRRLGEWEPDSEAPET